MEFSLLVASTDGCCSDVNCVVTYDADKLRGRCCVVCGKYDIDALWGMLCGGNGEGFTLLAPVPVPILVLVFILVLVLGIGSVLSFANARFVAAAIVC